MKTTVSLKCFVNDCFWKQHFSSNSPQTTSKLNFVGNFGHSKAYHCFNLKLEQLSCKKVLKFVLLGNSFSDLITEVEIWY